MSNNLGVSLADYAGDQSFSGNGSAAELAELSKAMEAGQITGRETTGSLTSSGAPLKVESLEGTLKVLTFKETDIAFWKRVPKLAAYNTVEEYNQLVDYGNQSSGSFTNEGELPESDDSVYTRQAQIVKFMGTTRKVSHPMQLVKTNIGDMVQKEIKNGTMFLLRKADRALAYGDANVVPQEFNGFITQQRQSFTNLDQYYNSGTVIDLRGKALSEGSVESGSLQMITNYGMADTLMAPPVVLSDLVKRFYDSKFIQPNTEALTNGIMGQRVQKLQTQFGAVELGYDIFLGANPARYSNSGATSSKAPATPAGALTATAVTDTSSIFNSSTEAGDFYYAIAAKNSKGESALAPIASSALVTVASGQAVNLVFTTGGGTYAPTGYVVYRSKKNPGTAFAATLFYPIFELSVADLAAGFDGGSAGVVRDRNRYLAGCEKAMLLQSDEEVFSFKQLAPLMKMDLATLDPSTRFMILMYGTPMLYAPRKMVTYINIGRDIS